MNTTYSSANAAALERLQTVVAKLSDSDLIKTVGDEWTVASTLVHMAFWDVRQLALLRHWEQNGVVPTPSESDSINAAVQALAQQIRPSAAVALVLAAAENIDKELESITPQLAAAIEAAGHPNVLQRFVHRNAHLDDIVRALHWTS